MVSFSLGSFLICVICSSFVWLSDPPEQTDRTGLHGSLKKKKKIPLKTSASGYKTKSKNVII